MNYTNILNELEIKYNELPKSENEANITFHIVKPFLETLGYNSSYFKYQERTDSKGVSDILIEYPNSEKSIIVETKRKNFDFYNSNHEFTKEAIDAKDQLIKYLSTLNIEWGILTNGKYYFLINNKLDLPGKDKDCISIELFTKSPWQHTLSTTNILINYFSYDYIFKRNASKLLSYFHLYTIKSLNSDNKNSYYQYESANFNFFNFLIKQEDTVDINDLTPKNLKKFFNSLLKKKPNYKTTTFQNKFNYIKSFVDFLEKEKILTQNPFNVINMDDFINELNLESKKVSVKPITNEELRILISQFNKNTSEGLRNNLIVRLICYLGLDFTTIINIKEKDIDLEKNKLKINKKNIPLPKSFIYDLKTYIEFRKKDKVKKIPNLFYRQYNNTITPISVWNINDITSKAFKKVTSISNERKHQLTYALIKSSLVKKLYHNGYSLEEISYCTNLNIISVFKYLDESDKKNHLKQIDRKLINNHPFSDII